jgi:hypothetical protein
MRKLPPKRLQMIQKWVFLGLAPVMLTLPVYRALLTPTVPHFTPHCSTS